MSNQTLIEAKRLWDMGFAVLWLRAREKRPVKSGWTTGERETWDELKRQYRLGYNLGVRLGRASRIGGSYLACLDLDIKEIDSRPEAEKCLREVVQGRILPEVTSGGGHGSRHLYFLTSSPFKMVKLGGEKGKWELCAYSEGRQMVLPPSTHPSGRKYEWGRNSFSSDSGLSVFDSNLFNSLGLRDVVESDQKSESASAKNTSRERPNKAAKLSLDESLDVRWDPRIAEAMRKAIVDGKWRGADITDRSDFLLTAANSLFRSGLNESEVLGVLTDRSTFLGATAFDEKHRNTNDRYLAADWVRRYTAQKARSRIGEGLKKASDYEKEPELEKWELELQAEEMSKERSWTQDLQKTENGVCKNTLNNVYLILKNSFGQPLFRFNQFAKHDEVWQDTDWGTEKGTEFQERDVQKIKLWVSQKFKFQASDDNIWSAMINLSDENSYHPIKTYLENLKPWDGIQRVDFFLRKYLKGDAPEKYMQAVSRKTIVAMVARVFEPGVKFDTMLVLEGAQGLRKSTAIATLASKAWFSDVNLNLKNKDSIADMAGKWVLEQGEMNVLSKHDVAELKQFLSRDTDRMRPSYGRKSQDYPRQSIFIGTTNENIYLKDTSGSRRFWPIKVTGECDIEAIKRDRDQIFAEAVTIYKAGEPIWIPDAETNHLALQQQTERELSDELVTVLEDWIEEKSTDLETAFSFDPDCLKMLDFWGNETSPGPLRTLSIRMDSPGQRRVAECLRVMGYERKRVVMGEKKRVVWKRHHVDTIKQ